MKLNYGTLGLIVVFGLIFLKQALGLPWTGPRITGLAIAIPSFLLLALARIQLGRAFSLQAKASTLVTTGLYSRIRNPIYFFGALMILGVIVWSDRPMLLLVLCRLNPVAGLQDPERRTGAGREIRREPTWITNGRHGFNPGMNSGRS